MRVLHVNKFAYAKGGAEVYAREAARRQAAAGHTVALLGARGDVGQFEPVPGMHQFDVQIDEFRALPLAARPKAAIDVVWSRSAAARIEDVVREFAPDVVHLHNYAHQLSSSIVARLRRLRVRTVNTAHDYKLICPAYVANIDGEDCFTCARVVSPKLLFHRCHHGSATWSAVAAAESVAVRATGTLPDVLIAPSEFMRRRLLSSWAGALRPIELLRNPSTAKQRWVGGEQHALFVGRLSREKGIPELIASAHATGLPLVIAGDGPIRESAEVLARQLGADVRFLGHVGADRLAELRRTCRLQIVSSTWPENAPLALLEAAVEGVPIVATARGGVPELQDLGAPITLVDDMNADQLGSAIARLPTVDDGELVAIRELLSWDRHIQALSDIYAA